MVRAGCVQPRGGARHVGLLDQGIERHQQVQVDAAEIGHGYKSPILSIDFNCAVSRSQIVHRFDEDERYGYGAYDLCDRRRPVTRVAEQHGPGFAPEFLFPTGRRRRPSGTGTG